MFIIKKSDNRSIVKKAVSIFSAVIFCLVLFYVLFSPVIIATARPAVYNSELRDLISFLDPFQTAFAATSASTSQTVNLTVAKEITMTASSSTLTFSATIGGITGGTASGTETFTVLNSSQNGFNLTLNADSTIPAMRLNGASTSTAVYNSFADYYPATGSATPTYSWTAPNAGSSSFGFAVGADSAHNAGTQFQYVGSTCNTSGSNSSAQCWLGFAGTSPITIINTNNSGGTGFSSAPVNESVVFQAQHTTLSTFALESGAYRATITATAYTN